MEMREIAAQPFRFWIMGRMYGAATVKKVMRPKTAVTATVILK